MALLTAFSVIREDAGGRVIYVTAFPGLVGHPEGGNHLGLTGIVFLEDLAIEQRLFGERTSVGIFPDLFGKLRVGILLRSILDEVVSKGRRKAHGLLGSGH